MEANQKAHRPAETAGLYLEAMHGDVGGWARDAMVSCASSIPGIVGLGLRSLWLRLWIKGAGRFAVESGTRLLGTKYITIDRGVFLDRGVYLHGRPGGLVIGAGTRIMQGAVIHVYNFRDLPNSGIRIGRDCVIGFRTIITGQGGVVLEDEVIVAPGVMVLPVDHVFEDPGRPIKDQGLSAKGVRIGRGSWIGAGAMILDGVTIGENAVAAAGAVVTRDVPARTMVAGNPAQAVKEMAR